MLSTGIPELKTADDLQYLRRAFLLDVDEAKATAAFLEADLCIDERLSAPAWYVRGRERARQTRREEKYEERREEKEGKMSDERSDNAFHILAHK